MGMVWIAFYFLQIEVSNYLPKNERRSKMYNIEIRNALKENRIFGYQIAAHLGIAETSFSRKLARKELTEAEKKTIYKIIDKITKGESR